MLQTASISLHCSRRNWNIRSNFSSQSRRWASGWSRGWSHDCTFGSDYDQIGANSSQNATMSYFGFSLRNAARRTAKPLKTPRRSSALSAVQKLPICFSYEQLVVATATKGGGISLESYSDRHSSALWAFGSLLAAVAAVTQIQDTKTAESCGIAGVVGTSNNDARYVPLIVPEV